VKLPRWLRLTLWVVGTRLLAELAMVAGSYRPRPDDDLHWVGVQDGLFYDQVPIRWLDVWGRWDSSYYWKLARGGYGALAEGEVAFQAAYFPLFPSLMRGLSVLLGGVEPFLCGVLLANVMLALAVVYLDRLARLDGGEALGEAAVVALMAYPGSHFLSCVYPESTALFLAALALYAARTGRPLLAGLACMLATVTRSSGALLALPVAVELLTGRDGRWAFRPGVLWLGLPGLTGGWWLWENWVRFGHPLYFAQVQGAWGRKPTFFLEPLLSTSLSLDHHLFTLLGVGGVVLGLAQRQRASLILLAALQVLLPLSTGLMRGIHRYLSSNVALFLFAGRALQDRPGWRRAYALLGLTVMVVFAYRWGQGYQPN
jgi:hypothetical protein